MNKNAKKFAVLAVLIFLTMLPVNAAPLYDRDGQISPKLDILCPEGSDTWGIHTTQLGTSVTFIDNSEGKVLWKKWYVDNKLVDTTTAKYVYYQFKQLGTHSVTLKVANHGGAVTDTKWVNVITEHTGP